MAGGATVMFALLLPMVRRWKGPMHGRTVTALPGGQKGFAMFDGGADPQGCGMPMARTCRTMNARFRMFRSATPSGWIGARQTYMRGGYFTFPCRVITGKPGRCMSVSYNHAREWTGIPAFSATLNVRNNQGSIHVCRTSAVFGKSSACNRCGREYRSCNR